MRAITVYGGLDLESRIALERVKLAALILSSGYGLPVSISEVTLPIGADEAGAQGLPEVWVEIDGKRRRVSSGRAPLALEIVEAIFDILEELYGSPLVAPASQGLWSDEAEEGFLGV